MDVFPPVKTEQLFDAGGLMVSISLPSTSAIPVPEPTSEEKINRIDTKDSIAQILPSFEPHSTSVPASGVSSGVKNQLKSYRDTTTGNHVQRPSVACGTQNVSAVHPCTVSTHGVENQLSKQQRRRRRRAMRRAGNSDIGDGGNAKAVRSLNELSVVPFQPPLIIGPCTVTGNSKTVSSTSGKRRRNRASKRHAGICNICDSGSAIELSNASCQPPSTTGPCCVTGNSKTVRSTCPKRRWKRRKTGTESSDMSKMYNESVPLMQRRLPFPTPVELPSSRVATSKKTTDGKMALCTTIVSSYFMSPAPAQYSFDFAAPVSSGSDQRMDDTSISGSETASKVIDVKMTCGPTVVSSSVASSTQFPSSSSAAMCGFSDKRADSPTTSSSSSAAVNNCGNSSGNMVSRTSVIKVEDGSVPDVGDSTSISPVDPVAFLPVACSKVAEWSNSEVHMTGCEKELTLPTGLASYSVDRKAGEASIIYDTNGTGSSTVAAVAESGSDTASVICLTDEEDVEYIVIDSEQSGDERTETFPQFLPELLTSFTYGDRLTDEEDAEYLIVDDEDSGHKSMPASPAFLTELQSSYTKGRQSSSPEPCTSDAADCKTVATNSSSEVAIDPVPDNGMSHAQLPVSHTITASRMICHAAKSDELVTVQRAAAVSGAASVCSSGKPIVSQINVSSSAASVSGTAASIAVTTSGNGVPVPPEIEKMTSTTVSSNSQMVPVVSAVAGVSSEERRRKHTPTGLAASEAIVIDDDDEIKYDEVNRSCEAPGEKDDIKDVDTEASQHSLQPTSSSGPYQC